MSAPTKPWERVGTNTYQGTGGPSFANAMSSSPLTGMDSTGFETPSVSQIGQQPPPIPMRSVQPNSLTNNYGSGGYSGLNSMYSPYSSMYGGNSGYYSGLGSYGGTYGGLGGYGSTYGGYGMNRYMPGNENSSTNTFTRLAEENSRVAFQSVESVVQAFGAVSMMLESTYFAVYNSFRAVVGVADQFSRFKTQLFQILCTLALLKRFKWFLNKILVLLRLRKAGLPDDIWKEVAASTLNDVLPDGDSIPKKSNWPIFVFVSLIVGAPWLIWKALSSMAGNIDTEAWKTGKSEHYLAVASYSFVGRNDDEVSFRAGQKVIIAPKGLQPSIRGWLLATIDGKTTGLIPANFVKILGKSPGIQQRKVTTPSMVPSASAPQISEVHQQYPDPFEQTFINNVNISDSTPESLVNDGSS